MAQPQSYTWYHGGYASGGLVTTYGANRMHRMLPQPGMDGFAGAGEYDLAAGTVTGIRWWLLPVPDLNKNPLAADEHWPARNLAGAQAEWGPGLNEARCHQGYDHPVPWESCGCGFWGFWREQRYGLGGLPVLGMIEGSGRVIIGEKGFRCQRARIVALHLPGLPDTRLARGGWYDAYSDVLVLQGDAPPPPDDDWLDAWRGVISDRLDRLYPEAKVYELKKAMLTMHPPDTEYLPEQPAG